METCCSPCSTSCFYWGSKIMINARKGCWSILCQDDFYDGYFIPKGSMVIPNVWWVNVPFFVWSDSDNFVSGLWTVIQKFMVQMEINSIPRGIWMTIKCWKVISMRDTSLMDLAKGVSKLIQLSTVIIMIIIFRVCVGRHVANNSLFIQIAIILWAMSLEPAKDSSGNPIRPNVHAEEQNGIFMCVKVPANRKLFMYLIA